MLIHCPIVTYTFVNIFDFKYTCTYISKTLWFSPLRTLKYYLKIVNFAKKHIVALTKDLILSPVNLGILCTLKIYNSLSFLSGSSALQLLYVLSSEYSYFLFLSTYRDKLIAAKLARYNLSLFCQVDKSCWVLSTFCCQHLSPFSHQGENAQGTQRTRRRKFWN